ASRLPAPGPPARRGRRPAPRRIPPRRRDRRGFRGGREGGAPGCGGRPRRRPGAAARHGRRTHARRLTEGRPAMIRIAIEAPFAPCSPMTAGWHRPTAGFLTHSAAYGRVLNLAGVESRLGEHEPGHPGGVPASVTRDGLPTFRLALGIPEGAG